MNLDWTAEVIREPCRLGQHRQEVVPDQSEFRRPDAAIYDKLRFVDGDKYVFSSLNPSTGTTKELTRISYRAPFTNWSLAPDRDLVAVVHGDDNIVRLIDLSTHEETPLEVENLSKFEFVEWAADGQSLFLNAGISFAGDYAVLLQVNMDGQAHILRAVPNVWHVEPTPSPDGRYLAFAAMPFHGNIWLIRDF